MRVDVRDFGAVGDGVTDDSDAFIAAIDAAVDGAVFIPAGRYVITKVLAIRKSGIVLRGEDRDSTILYFPKTLHEILGAGRDGGPTGWSWGGGWIWVNPNLNRGDSNGPVWNEGLVLARVTSAAPKGQTWIEVEDSSAISAGQWVRLVQYESDGSLTLSLHDGHALNGRCILD
ncbi:MAG: glycoside hydrolase family 55 protein, partial [Acidobacteriota bacterium]|nr:glycoside hydrolase family 55 protein [Acidobacteriota bacterium]